MESSLIALTADYISITDMSLGGVLGLCCAGVWVTRAPRTCTIRPIHAPQGPRRSMGISDRHILVPYLWIRPISAWVGLGSRTKKRSIMRSFLAFGACTTIPIWAMLWVM